VQRRARLQEENTALREELSARKVKVERLKNRLSELEAQR